MIEMANKSTWSWHWKDQMIEMTNKSTWSWQCSRNVKRENHLLFASKESNI